MAVTIDSLELKIQHESDGAVKGIDRLVRALRRLKTAAGMGADLSTVAKGIRAIASATGSLSGGKMKKVLDGIKASAAETKEEVEGVKKALTMTDISNAAHASLKKVENHWGEIVAKAREASSISQKSPEDNAKIYEAAYHRSFKTPSIDDKNYVPMLVFAYEEAKRKIQETTGSLKELNAEQAKVANSLAESAYAGSLGLAGDPTAQTQAIIESISAYKSEKQLAAEAKQAAIEKKRAEKEAAAEAERAAKSAAQREKDLIKQYNDEQKAIERVNEANRKRAQKLNEKAQRDSLKEQTKQIKENNAEYAKVVGMFSKGAGLALGIGEKILGKITGVFKSAVNGYKRLVNMVKRMVILRIIRNALKMIEEGLQEGRENIYQYSVAIGDIDAAHAKSTLNELATAALYVKNSIGAAAMPAIQAFTPLLKTLASWAVQAANAINQLISAMQGKSSFTRAKEYAVDYMDSVKDSAGGASKAAKDLRATLLAFDEINRLDAPDKGSGSGGGGGGSAKLDYKSMFEEATIDSDVSAFVDKIKDKIKSGDWKGVGTLIGNKLNEVISKIDTKTIGKKITTVISNGAKLVSGFLKATDFKKIGEKIEDFIDGAIEGIDSKAFADTVTGVLTGVIDVMIGFVGRASKNETGVRLANKLYIFLKNALRGVKDYLKSTEWDKVGTQLFKILDDFVENFDYSDISNDFWNTLGHAWVASNSLTAGFIAPAVQKWIKSIKDELDSKESKAGFADIAWKIISGVLGLFTPILILRGIPQFYEKIISPWLGGIVEGLGGEEAKKKFDKIGEKLLERILKGIVDAKFTMIYLFADLGVGLAQAFFDFDDNQRKKISLTIVKAIKNAMIAAVELLLGDTTLGKLGKKVINNFFDPIIGKTNTLHSGLTRVLDDIKKIGNSQVTIKSKSVGSATGSYLGGYYTQMKAAGGYVDQGDLFIANEAGPELIGTVNGRTAVAPNAEITGIANAVYAMGEREIAAINNLTRALNAKDMTAVVTADSIVAGLARKNRRDGVSTVPVSM